MSFRDRTCRDRGLDGRVELEQAEGIGDRGASTPHALGEFLMGESELVDQLSVGARGLERVEVLALQVLDEGQLELLAIRELANDGGDVLQPRDARRPGAPLPGDELVALDASPSPGSVG